jgi:hypothetical protein
VVAPERVSPSAAGEGSGAPVRAVQEETGTGGASGGSRSVRKPTANSPLKKSKAARAVGPGSPIPTTPSRPLNDAVIID